MRGVRIIVVGIGPDARKPKYRQVLDYIGGTNLFFVDDYKSLDDATNDILTLICREYIIIVSWHIPISLIFFYNFISWLGMASLSPDLKQNISRPALTRSQ